MSLIPGNDGSKAIFKDGMQVDYIDENTIGVGVHVRGAIDGIAIPTGYQGEIYAPAPDSSTVQITSTSVSNVYTASVPAGAWLISATMVWSAALSGTGIISLSTNTLSATVNLKNAQGGWESFSADGKSRYISCRPMPYNFATATPVYAVCWNDSTNHINRTYVYFDAVRIG